MGTAQPTTTPRVQQQHVLVEKRAASHRREIHPQQQIADVISEETGREVRYQHLTADDWSRQLYAHSGGLPNHTMIQHITTLGEMCENNTAIMRKDIDPSALAAASGRPPQTFRNFVR